ncbi:MAG TPA: glutathione S-transferase family protein [Thermoplasmata archaeon]|nr:glutathione S-transferase family protein [Thermoplasmata archaeon]
MASRPVLYSMPISHWCVSADRMLAFKGVDFDTTYVPYHDKTELIAATGQDYVPTLVWGGKPVMWYDIPDFLEETVPEPTLYPYGNKGLATIVEQWAHAVTEEKVWRYVVTKIPPVLRDDRERWVFEEMQTRARGPWHVLETRREEFRQDMMKELARIDGTLQRNEWILGMPSLADFGVYGSLSPLLTIGESVPREMGRLAAWVGRIGAIGATAAPPAPA